MSGKLSVKNIKQYLSYMGYDVKGQQEKQQQAIDGDTGMLAPVRDFVKEATQYCIDVVKHKIPSCKWQYLACRRHLDDLYRWKYKDKKAPYYFDRGEAQKVAMFFTQLSHVKGEWGRNKEPFVLAPWQSFLWCSVFGWKRRKDGYRRFREVFNIVPRKAGKSLQGAALGLYMLAMDNEPGAEVYCGATTEKQAWEVFGTARIMAQRSPLLQRKGIEVNARNINIVETASKFEPIIGNPGDGSNPHCAIVDEFHEHTTPDLYDTMLTGMGARKQPLMVVITTAGVNLAGPCYDKLLQCRKTIEGINGYENDELFFLEFGIDEDDDWQEFDCWAKANPNMNISISEDFLRARLKEAQQRASRQNIIRCKHLNQWVNASEAWMNMVFWEKTANKEIKMLDFRGKKCYLGLDLASKIDIAALSICFYEGGNVYTFGKYYLPEDTVYGDTPNAAAYQGWAKDGYLTLTPGATTDYRYIEEDIKEISKQFQILEINYDPFQATEFSVRMEDEGFTMVEVRPTVLNFSEPMKEMEKLTIDGTLIHDGNPVLTWMVSNVVCKLDNKDNIYPTKEFPQNKIDGVVALLMSLGRIMKTREPTSKYESEDLLFL